LFLQNIIADIEQIDRFTDFLRPRIDGAAVILLSCTARKEELSDLITDELSSWTTCINDKSTLLTGLFHESGDADFFLFLSDLRDEYDALKD
jgi:hypothetical protein